MNKKLGSLKSIYVAKELNPGLYSIELLKYNYSSMLKTFINNDMTKIEIQKAPRSRAKEKREKGNTAKVGYQKILINDQWVNWPALPRGSTT